MNITVLAVGNKMPRWVSEATEEYAKRFGREINFSIKELKPEKRGSGVNAEQGMLAEEARILAAIPQGSFVVVLDERGQAPTSVQLSEHMGRWLQEGQDVCFIIGGAYGLDEAVRQRAWKLVSLSSMTFPHELARVLLLEQLYRAECIIRKVPYHH